ncbi:MAG: type II CRISPR RNA-guided endonuclease Cas9 [Geothrix sp.]|nr:type II CRISPR RNA-guided endonuclease Cas9 [Geothrix sp.]
MHDLFLALVGGSLLPKEGDLRQPLSLRIFQTLKALDASLLAAGEDPIRLPYALRAKALAGQLEPFALGRALYHLGQRRGFKSNRKAARKEGEEETGKVRGGIETLRQRMASESAPTLGRLFSRHNPEDHSASPNHRIRGRYTSRDMIEAEFEAIWAEQANHHPQLLTPALKARVHKCIFFQRPLKSAEDLVGWCSLEQGRWVKIRKTHRRDGRPLDTPTWVPVYKAPRRMPLAHPKAQRFRILQKVNDLKILWNDGTTAEPDAAQRQWLLDGLDQGDMSFVAMKAQWGIGRRGKLNLAEGPAKGLPGNRTFARIEKAAPGFWDRLDGERRESLIRAMRHAEDSVQFAASLQSDWLLAPGEAAKLADTSLEEGYLSLSRQAVEKLLPWLERGVPYSTAVKQVYGEEPAQKPVDKLPRVIEAFPALRNPMVARTLTELRKVVHAVIRAWGKPVAIRIELARDLKKSRDIRASISKKIADRTKNRDKAREAIRPLKSDPKGRDIEKYLLWEECGGPMALCPYTGKPITLHELFQESSPWDVEHIIPFSKSLDDSFANKTLCWAEHNRNVKRNRAPMEAYAPEAMADMLGRVENWPDGPGKTVKLQRFRQTELDGDFISSQLNDTAHASRLACQYLALLYGGLWDGEARRIYASKGQVTAMLRGLWDLNPLLGGREKNRQDHRHHALDALVIAVTSPAALKALSDASRTGWESHRSRFATFALPWADFARDASAALEAITISRRVRRKLQGRIHKDTIYGVDGDSLIQRIRVEELSAKDIVKIVDPEIRRRVEIRLEELGSADPKKAFKEAKDHPYMLSKDGRQIPIHRVRIKVSGTVMPVGQGHRLRQVESDANHHMTIHEAQDARGRTVWKAEVVSQFEALRRHAASEPVIRRGEGFVMSLRSGDTVQYSENGVLKAAWIRTVQSNFQIGLVSHLDARLKKDQAKDGEYFMVAPSRARELGLQKTQVNPLGQTRISRD